MGEAGVVGSCLSHSWAVAMASSARLGRFGSFLLGISAFPDHRPIMQIRSNEPASWTAAEGILAVNRRSKRSYFRMPEFGLKGGVASCACRSGFTLGRV
jgi:hypothetical protein